MHQRYRWAFVVIWGLLSLPACGTQKDETTAAFHESFATPSAPGSSHPAAPQKVSPHVLTAEYLGWNGGYMGPAATMSRYASWAIGGDPAAVHAAGMKIYAYTDPNRSYYSDDDYRIHDLLREHPRAIARNCFGAQITTSHGKGLLTDVRTAEAVAHLTSLVQHVYRADIDAVFVDDSNDVLYTDNGQPCRFSQAAWLEGTRAMLAAQPAPLIFNGLSMAEYGVDSLPLADVVNVAGGMWEGCYGFHAEWGVPGDGTNGLREHWTDIENAELAMAAKNKMFWCFNTARAEGAANIALRTYAYASFLLTYDAKTSLYETQLTTPSNLRIFPETGLVPASPLTPAPPTVSALQSSAGAYGREFARCSYRGRPIGACAVVVNPDSVAHATPYAANYRHTVTLRGAGVIDSGTLSTDGSRVPPALAAHTAAILAR